MQTNSTRKSISANIAVTNTALDASRNTAHLLVFFRAPKCFSNDHAMF